MNRYIRRIVCLLFLVFAFQSANATITGLRIGGIIHNDGNSYEFDYGTTNTVFTSLTGGSSIGFVHYAYPSDLSQIILSTRLQRSGRAFAATIAQLNPGSYSFFVGQYQLETDIDDAAFPFNTMDRTKFAPITIRNQRARDVMINGESASLFSGEISGTDSVEISFTAENNPLVYDWVTYVVRGETYNVDAVFDEASGRYKATIPATIHSPVTYWIESGTNKYDRVVREPLGNSSYSYNISSALSNAKVNGLSVEDHPEIGFFDEKVVTVDNTTLYGVTLYYGANGSYSSIAMDNNSVSLPSNLSGTSVDFYFQIEDPEYSTRLPLTGVYTFNLTNPISSATINGEVCSTSVIPQCEFNQGPTLSVVSDTPGGVRVVVRNKYSGVSTIDMDKVGNVFTATLPINIEGGVSYYFEVTDASGQMISRYPVGTTVYNYNVKSPFGAVSIDGENATTAGIQKDITSTPTISTSLVLSGNLKLWLSYKNRNKQNVIVEMTGTPYSAIIPRLETGDVTYLLFIASTPTSNRYSQTPNYTYTVKSPIESVLIDGEVASTQVANKLFGSNVIISVVGDIPADMTPCLMYDGKMIEMEGTSYSATIKADKVGSTSYRVVVMDGGVEMATSSSHYIEVSNPLSNPKLDGETSSETSSTTVKDFGLINTVSVDSAVNGYIYWVEYLNASGQAEKLQLEPQGGSYVGQLPLMPAGVASYRFCLGNSIDGDVLAKLPESGYYKFTVTAPMSNPLINGNPCSLTEIQSFTFDNPPTLKIDVNTANEVLVWLVYSHNGGAKSYLPMTLESGNTYSVTFPVLPAGTISYNFEVGSELGVPLAKFSNYDYSFTIEDSLDEDRHPDMLKWQQAYASTSALGFKSVNPLSTAASGIRWTGTDIFMDSRRLYLNSQSTSTLGSYVRLFGRVPIGTVWILAQYVGDDDTEGSLVVDFGVLGVRDYVYNESIPVSVPREGGKRVLIKIPYNSEEPKSVRIRQLPGVDSGNIIIDDIVITPPAADVTIIKDEVDYHPGYPSRWDPIDFYVTVANKFDDFPATAIVPKLVWRLNNGDWNHTPMEQIGASGKYHVQLPTLDPGIFEYFYRVDFTGYSYNYQVRDKNAILNIDEFAPWLEASGTDIISEAQNPAYLPDFKDSNLCDLENIPYESTEEWKENWRNYEYLKFDVRRFRSNYENLILRIDPFVEGENINTEPMYKMDQVGNYTWQAIINATNVINVATYVDGTKEYNGSGSTTWGSDKRWMEQNQETINPPMAGVAENNRDVPESDLEKIHIDIDYQGFLMFRFDTRTGKYEVRRAAWQDFNTWAASETEFARSFGLFEMTTYESNLDDRSATEMDFSPFLPFENTDVQSIGGMSTDISGVLIRYANLIQERNRVANATGERVYNKALAISANPYSLGSLETTSLTQTRGRDTLKMKVRASIDDKTPAYYRRGITFEDYIVSADISPTQISSAYPWVSVVGYYVDADNYFELRLGEASTPDKDTTRAKLVADVYQIKDGAEIKLNTKEVKIADKVGDVTIPKNLEGSKWKLSLSLQSAGSNEVTANALIEFFNPNSGNYSEIAAITNNVNKAIISNDVFPGGTIGVNSYDAVGTFEMAMSNLDKSANTEFDKATKGATQNYWYLGGKMIGTEDNRWSFTPKSASSFGCRLTRTMPIVGYRVQVYRNNLENSYSAPCSDGEWTDFYSSHVNSLKFADVEIPLHLWDNVFMKIVPLATGSDGYLVIDDLECHGWRGVLDYDPVLPPNDPLIETVWRATYHVRSLHNHNMKYELALSRANPDELQMIVSPLLREGIGDIVFNYEITGGPVTFRVQRNTFDGAHTDDSAWVDIATNVIKQTTMQERFYTAALTNMEGRIRIVVDRAESDPNGVLWIDNLKVTDYPVVGNGSWSAYNVLVSTFPTEPEKKFDGVANTEFRSTALNNSYDKDTMGGINYDSDKPYIQTPLIDTGVGEISFWYRAYTPDSGLPSKIRLMVAPTVDTPSDQWKEITVDDLNEKSDTYLQQVEQLLALQNITEEQWVYFNIEIYDKENKVLRLYSDVAGVSRPMLDNVLITEPVRSSIEIGTVVFNPDIPLYTDDVDVFVRLKNPRMNPNVTNVVFSYYVGTNVWGRKQWENGSSVKKVNLVQDTEDEMLYSAEGVVPRLPIDEVVQYNVTVYYDGVFPEPVNYNEIFVNPEWYAPVDLNKINGTETDSTRTPYYFVFSVSTNKVFINEFFPSTRASDDSKQFVELIGPENADISGWTLEHYAYNSEFWKGDYMTSFYTNVIKSGARFVYDPEITYGTSSVTNKGWGFYVIGNNRVASPARVDQELFPASAGYYLSGGSNGEAGAMILKRSMGAYVEKIAWGPRVATTYLDHDFDLVSSSAGGGRAFMRTFELNSEGQPVQQWSREASFSPGGYNFGQDMYLSNIPAVVEPANESAELMFRVTRFVVNGDDTVTINMAVRTINNVALTADNAWAWYVQTSADMTFATPTDVEIQSVITAEADGSEALYEVTLPSDVMKDAEFFRIKGVPRQ